MSIIEDKLSRQPTESPKEYQIRLCKNRDEYGLTWSDLAHILNEEYKENKSESVYRKWWYAFSDGCEYTNSMYKDIPKGTSYEDIQNLQEINDNGEPKKIETIVNNNGQETSVIRVKLTEEQQKDPEYLLKIHGYDPEKWDLLSAKQTIWNQENKTRGMQDLFSSKISVAPKIGFDWNEKNITKIFDSLGKDRIFKKKEKKNKVRLENNLLLVPLADIHFGLLATRELAGEEYNIKIAKKRVKYVIEDLIHRVENKDIDRIVFLLGNDGLNADNIAGTTTRGTPQDNQVDWFETVRQFTDLMAQVLEELKNIAPVTAYFCPSNHDLQSMFMICETLKAYFRNDSDVTIYNEATQRKYFRYGVNMIGFSHDEKEKNVAKIMAAEQPAMWGETKYKYFLISHLHCEIVRDDFGVDIRRLPTISGKSYWTNREGFVGTKKQSQAFLFNADKGLVEIFNTIIDD